MIAAAFPDDMSSHESACPAMKPLDFQKAVSVFHKAVALDGRERDRYLSEACGDDAALRRHVANLLEHDEQTSRLGDGPDPAMDRDDTVTQHHNTVSIGEGPGSRIGPYKLLQKIGEGGFGVVYMAEQTNACRAPKSSPENSSSQGMDSKEVIASIRGGAAGT